MMETGISVTIADCSVSSFFPHAATRRIIAIEVAETSRKCRRVSIVVLSKRAEKS
jgi:hypothetical protein